MAGPRPNEPVMKCSAKQFKPVSILAKRIITKGVYFNVAIYTTPNVLKTDFITASGLLDTAITSARGNTAIKQTRNKLSIAMFDLMVILLTYVKTICGHDVDLINDSGYYLNNQPVKLPAPDQVIINRIVKGKIDGTYKAFIVRNTNKEDVNQDSKTHLTNVTYCIEITTTPDVANSWINVLAGVKSTKLVFSNYTPLVMNYVRIYGVNTAGKGPVSQVYSFIPQ